MTALFVIGVSLWFAFPEPRRGGLIIAQGKAAEAAVLGKKSPHPTSFSLPVWRASGKGHIFTQQPQKYADVRP